MILKVLMLLTSGDQVFNCTNGLVGNHLVRLHLIGVAFDLGLELAQQTNQLTNLLRGLLPILVVLVGRRH